MDECKVIQVIKTTLLRRGDGKDDPIRIITQYWDFDGRLLWENDPVRDRLATSIEASGVKR